MASGKAIMMGYIFSWGKPFKGVIRATLQVVHKTYNAVRTTFLSFVSICKTQIIH